MVFAADRWSQDEDVVNDVGNEHGKTRLHENLLGSNVSFIGEAENGAPNRKNDETDSTNATYAASTEVNGDGSCYPGFSSLGNAPGDDVDDLSDNCESPEDHSEK